MNKYVFPGADASLPLGWVISSASVAYVCHHFIAEGGGARESQLRDKID